MFTTTIYTNKYIFVVVDVVYLKTMLML